MSDKASVFRFKKFSILQKNGVFKVNTDACLLGAYAASFLEQTPHLAASNNRYLDIGTGTGVIACMLAQTSEAQVTGIDINEAAIELAAENFEVCIWKQRINTELADVLQLEAWPNFQIITCNPPYFTNSLKSPNYAKNLARHNDVLSPQNLIKKVDELLGEDGYFFVIYPPTEAEILVEHAIHYGMHLQEIMQVQPLPNKEIHRKLMRFGRKSINLIVSKDLLIEQQSGKYSEKFKHLLKNFYLKL